MDEKNQNPQSKKKMLEARYYFFLNPYQKEAFTRCPKCDTKTKIRKYCLN